MAILDTQGRLFGKVSILDLGVMCVFLLVLAGILLAPGDTGRSIAQVGQQLKPVEVDALVMGLSARDPKQLLQAGDTTNLIIRNQPYGQIKIKSIQPLPKTVTVSQPDGSVKALNDPRPESKFSSNLILTLEGKGELTADGPVLGNSKIKVGTPVELEGKLYNFKVSVIDIRVAE